MKRNRSDYIKVNTYPENSRNQIMEKDNFIIKNLDRNSAETGSSSSL